MSLGLGGDACVPPTGKLQPRTQAARLGNGVSPSVGSVLPFLAFESSSDSSQCSFTFFFFFAFFPPCSGFHLTIGGPLRVYLHPNTS